MRTLRVALTAASVRTPTAALTAVVLALACSDDPHPFFPRPGGAQDSPRQSLSGDCVPPAPACGLAGSPCLSRLDATDKPVFAGRFSQLIPSAPAALADEALQLITVRTAIPLDSRNCYQYGYGFTTWLFRFDITAERMTVGAGPPVPPAGADRTCFMDFTDPVSKTHVTPMTVHATLGEDGTILADKFETLNLPLVLDDKGTDIIYLPLHSIELHDTKVSSDHNCIGRFKNEVFHASDGCADPMSERAWANGGHIRSFLLLEETDKVWIPDLKESLCVLLAQDPKRFANSDKKCLRQNGKIVFGGDWDSRTNSAKTGGDALQLIADFASSGIEVTGTVSQASAAALSCEGAR